MTLKSLEDALILELGDLLHAEKLIIDALPEMAKEASDRDLKDALRSHLKETREQVRRLERAFKALDHEPKAEKCDAMIGIIREGEKILKKNAESEVKDALIISACQKVEHYEIASYGAVCTWAELIGREDVADILKETMAEEKEADEKLTGIAKEVNEHATA